MFNGARFMSLCKAKSILKGIRHNSKDEAKKGDPSIFLTRNGVEELRKDYRY